MCVSMADADQITAGWDDLKILGFVICRDSTSLTLEEMAIAHAVHLGDLADLLASPNSPFFLRFECACAAFLQESRDMQSSALKLLQDSIKVEPGGYVTAARMVLDFHLGSNTSICAPIDSFSDQNYGTKHCLIGPIQSDPTVLLDPRLNNPAQIEESVPGMRSVNSDGYTRNNCYVSLQHEPICPVTTIRPDQCMKFVERTSEMTIQSLLNPPSTSVVEQIQTGSQECVRDAQLSDSTNNLERLGLALQDTRETPEQRKRTSKCLRCRDLSRKCDKMRPKCDQCVKDHHSCGYPLKSDGRWEYLPDTATTKADLAVDTLTVLERLTAKELRQQRKLNKAGEAKSQSCTSSTIGEAEDSDPMRPVKKRSSSRSSKFSKKRLDENSSARSAELMKGPKSGMEPKLSSQNPATLSNTTSFLESPIANDAICRSAVSVPGNPIRQCHDCGRTGESRWCQRETGERLCSTCFAKSNHPGSKPAPISSSGKPTTPSSSVTRVAADESVDGTTKANDQMEHQPPQVVVAPAEHNSSQVATKNTVFDSISVAERKVSDQYTTKFASSKNQIEKGHSSKLLTDDALNSVNATAACCKETKRPSGSAATETPAQSESATAPIEEEAAISSAPQVAQPSTTCVAVPATPILDSVWRTLPLLFKIPDKCRARDKIKQYLSIKCGTSASDDLSPLLLLLDHATSLPPLQQIDCTALIRRLIGLSCGSEACHDILDLLITRTSEDGRWESLLDWFIALL